MHNLLPTLRRSAAYLLRALADSPHQLLGRAPHLAPQVLIELLSTLTTLSDRKDDHLANDVRAAVAELSISFDTAAHDRHELPINNYALLELVVTHCVDGVLTDMRGPKLRGSQIPRQATLQLAALLRAARSHPRLNNEGVLHALHAALNGRAAALGQKVLDMLPAADDMFCDVGEVLCSMLVASNRKDIDCVAIVQSVSSALPQRKIPEAERLLLDVVYVLLQRLDESGSELGCESGTLTECLMESVPFFEVVKSNVLSDDLSTVERLTKILCALCHESIEMADKFCAFGVFEYLVERIRAITQGKENPSLEARNKLRLAIESIAAVVARNPSSLSQKWCYCLDVIVSVCEHFSDGPEVQMLTDILGHALKHAALPVFSEEIIDKFISFEMSLCAKMCHTMTRKANIKNGDAQVNGSACYEHVLTCGIEHLTGLFTRYRPNPQIIHSVLRVCEASTQLQSPLPCLFALMVQLLQQFTTLCEGCKGDDQTENGAIRSVGQRLLYIVFDLWAHSVEVDGGVEEGDQIYALNSTNDTFSLVDALSRALSPTFVSSGCCSIDDQICMRAWCWRYIPPRKIWHLLSEANRTACLEEPFLSQEQKELSAKRYLWSISRNERIPEVGQLAVVELSENLFLESLAHGHLKSDDNAMLLFQRGMDFDSLSSLGAPDMLTDALCERLRLVSFEKESSWQVLQALRCISFICFKYGLEFRMLQISPEVLESSFRNEDFSLLNSRDFSVFKQTLLRGRVGLSDVLAWNMFAENSQALGSSNISRHTEVWSLLCENSEVANSLVYALINSQCPQMIACCLLDMLGNEDAPGKLNSSFEKAGVVQHLCSLLKNLPMRSYSSTALELVDESYCSELKRASCFIGVLIHGGFISGARSNWNLLTVVCETFNREMISLQENADTFPLLCSLIRCLIAMVTKGGGKKVVAYLHQSGLTAQLIRVVRISRGKHLSQDQVISAAACLLVLVLTDSDSGTSAEIDSSLSCLVADVGCWKRLLCSFPMSSDGDRSCKVTNCCFLLDSLLTTSSLVIPGKHVLDSRCIALLLIRAASSSDTLLEEAALRVLTTMANVESSHFHGLSSLCLFRQLASRCMKKISSSAAQKVSEYELRFACSSVRCGHADDFLLDLEERLVAWHSGIQVKSGNDQDPCSKSWIKILQFLRSALQDRARLLEERNQSISRNVCQRITGDLKELKNVKDSTSADTLARVPQVISGRYSVALQASSGTIDLSRLPKVLKDTTE